MSTDKTLERIVGWRSQKGPQASNASGFRATGHRVLLYSKPLEKTSAGGIILVDKTVVKEEQRVVEATVIEIGCDAWSDKLADYCDVGDTVLVGEYTGKFHTSPVDGKQYRFVTDLDIITPIIGAERAEGESNG
jgi:co-chaperonin GroES (HSP10)